MKNKAILLTIALMLFASCTAFAQIYVSPDGDDSNNGTIESPYKTIEKAQAIARKSKQNEMIILRDGYYKLEDTITFGPADSGDTYMGFEGETAYIEGGFDIKADMLNPVSDEKVLSRLKDEAEANIYQIDLKKMGMTSIDDIPFTGTGIPETDAQNVLYCEGEMMHLARWPNTEYVKVGKVLSAGSGRNDTVKKGGVFMYDDEIVETWLDIDDIWMFGNWYYEWSPSTTAIANLDKEANTIATKHWSRYGFLGGTTYYYFNVFEELDYPGEYYIDREKLILYVYLEEKKDLYLSDTKKIIFSIKDAENLTFKNLTFQGTRNTAVDISGGDGVVFDSCTMRYIAKNAMNINSGYNHRVINSELYKLGAGGIFVSAGDREYLRLSNVLIENNHIYDFSEIVTTYTPAVRFNGIGITARHNVVHGTNHTAFQLMGNENILEYNEIYDCVRDNDDAGAIYAYMDGSSRGNIVRYNFFHDIGRRTIGSSTGSWAVYWDGFTSDREVYGNIFYDCQGGVMVNGGQLHKITNNIFVDCDRAVWVHSMVSFPSIDFWKECDKFEYNKGVWKMKYPEIVKYRDNNQYLMYRENTVGNNLYYDCFAVDVADVVHKDATLYTLPSYTVDAGEDIFVDPQSYNFNLKTSKYPGFEDVDITEMGFKDE